MTEYEVIADLTPESADAEDLTLEFAVKLMLILDLGAPEVAAELRRAATMIEATETVH